LDVMGKAQAEAAAIAVAPMAPDAVVSSDLSRAADTAAALAAATGSEVAFDVRLREIDLGAWQGLTRAEARSRFPEEYAGWQAGEDRRRGGGETYAEVGARAAECIVEWLDRLGAGSLLVAVTHGGTARATIGTLRGLDNCGWAVLEADAHGRGIRLASYNETAHPAVHGPDFASDAPVG
jgi:probable phosphoglycerate mutase